MNEKIGFLILIAIAAMSLNSCSDGDSGPSVIEGEPFDRQVLLINLADNLILPAYDSYNEALSDLQRSKDEFLQDPSQESLMALQGAWLIGYEAWQGVSIYDIGKAEEIGLRNFTNIYPTDIDLINQNAESATYNLTLPSNFDAQGFPALDYLLFGVGDNESSRIEILSGPGYSAYLSDIVDRLVEITSEVITDWNNGFRDSFIGNNGSSATASTDKIVNDFLFHYEKFLRAGKIGIPAGVFSGSPRAGLVEAPFAAIYSKRLFNLGFEASRDFFNGVSHTSGLDGIGLDDYLDHVANQNGTTSITGAIINQWNTAQNQVNQLLDDFGQQIASDNTLMLAAYDDIQRAVVLLKVDMMQALNIQVDFVDADGD